jgi:hypothetical protein
MVILSGADLSGTSTPPPSTTVNDTIDVMPIAGYLMPPNNFFTDVPLARSQVTIDEGFTAAVFFAAKTRVWDDTNTLGGRVKFWFTVEGGGSVRTSSMGIQQIVSGANSQRTLTASYLAGDDAPLSAGPYNVTVWARAEANAGEGFKRLWMTKDLPLVWFGRYVTRPSPCNKPCGNCNRGRWDCNQNQCVGDNPNQCGGCNILRGPRGGGCNDGLASGQCGRWTCSGPDVVRTPYGPVDECGGCSIPSTGEPRHKGDQCLCGTHGSDIGHVLVCSPNKTLVCCDCPGTPACR